jgi:hypothetical protein
MIIHLPSRHAVFVSVTEKSERQLHQFQLLTSLLEGIQP